MCRSDDVSTVLGVATTARPLSRDARTSRRRSSPPTFAGTFDEHGDLVGLTFVGEKVPRGGSDDFPDELVLPWKKLLRNAAFDGWVEGTKARRLFVDRGASHARDWYPERRRFEQIGPEPRCRPGDSIEVAFRYVSTIDDDTAAVHVTAGGDPASCHIEFSPRTMRPGDVATLVMRIGDQGPVYEEKAQLVMYGNEGKISVHGWISVALDVDDDLDQAHVVVATESDAAAWSGTYLSEKKAAAALEDVRRYAATGAVRLAHASSPRWWTAIRFWKGSLRRRRVSRSAPAT